MLMAFKKRFTSAASFMHALQTSTSGNTLAMMAAAMVPIAGVIGGGVDMGRGYMAKARLQQACDAGALAARRNMTQSTLTQADKDEGMKFFAFNFPEGSFGAKPFVANVVGGANPRYYDGASPRVVKGYAEVDVPTTIMGLFGFEYMTIAANCTSRLDVGNVDVMMVLDVTGSMGESIAGGSTKIAALKDAVKDFYDILGPGGTFAGERVRYGFIPYNSTVNVGEILYDANPDWLIGGKVDERYAYQTRRATWQVGGGGGGGGIPNEVPPGPPKSSQSSTTYQTYTSLDGPECVLGYSRNEAVDTWFVPNPSGNPLTTLSRNNGDIVRTTVTYSYFKWNNSTNAPPGNAVGKSYWKNCDRKVVTTVERWDENTPVQTYDRWVPGATKITEWEYGQFTHNVYDYVRSVKSGNPAPQVPTVDGYKVSRWFGCIEERRTDPGITATTPVIPANALDLNIDVVPSNNDSRWAPMWGENPTEGGNQGSVIYNRTSSTDGSYAGGSGNCPVKSRKLASYSSYSGGANSMESYVNALSANGNTNHAIGMIWGARLLSEKGLFAAENANAPNGFKVGRHIVFMTDGVLTQSNTQYAPWGFPTLDGRFAPTNASSNELVARQENRFQLICAAVRAKGYTIWAIQFGDGALKQNMISCAGDTDHAFAANSRQEIRDAFSNIAKKIGGLRLEQ